jgi:hypothetical protein
MAEGARVSIDSGRQAGRDASLPRALWSSLISVKFVVIAVGLLATLSVVGTLVPSPPITPPITVTDHASFVRCLTQTEDAWGPARARTYMYLHLYDVWHAWWYVLTLELVLLSAAGCTYDRLRAAIKRYREPRVPTPAGSFPVFRGSATSRTKLSPSECADRIERHLQAHRYRVFREEVKGETCLLARKGAASMFGPSVVHVSLLLCMLSALWGTLGVFGAFRSVMVVGEGQFAHEPHSDVWAGCSRFELKYTREPIEDPSGTHPGTFYSVSEFISEITFYSKAYGSQAEQYVEATGEGVLAAARPAVLDDSGKPIAQFGGRIEGLRPLRSAAIRVNHPVRQAGVDYYQGDWDLIGFRLQVRTPDGRERRYEIELQPMADPLGGVRYVPESVGISLPTNPPSDDHVVLVPRDFVPVYDEGGSTFAQGKTAPDPAVLLARVGHDESGKTEIVDVGWARQGATLTYQGTEIKFDSPIYRTVLDVRRQPGVRLLMFSFVTASLGLVLCFWVPLREVRVRVRAVGARSEVLIGMPKHYRGGDADRIVQAALRALRESKEDA